MKARLLAALFVLTSFQAHAGNAVEDFIKGLFARPRQYVALGKIMAAPPAEGAARYYATQLGTLQSPELLAAARARVAKAHPEVPAGSIEIRSMRSEGSMLLRVAGIGDGQIYTRLVLDALMDELMARQAAQAAGAKDSLMALLKELSVTEKECLAIQDKLAVAKVPEETAKLRQDFDQAKARYEDVKGRFEKQDTFRELDQQMLIIERPVVAILTR
jgi:hypothetical protein